MQGESMTVLQVSNVCDFHILQNIQVNSFNWSLNEIVS